MGGSHLTSRGGSWIFQRRIPAEHANSFHSWPIRVTIGPVGKRVAQRMARHLWVVAEDAFRELGARAMKEADPAANRRALLGRLDDWTAAFLPTLAVLNFDEGALPADIAQATVSAALDGLVDLGHRDVVGKPVPEPHRTVALRHYEKLPKDERLARQHLGLPPAPSADDTPIMSQLLAAVTALQRQGDATAQELRTMKAAQDPKIGPLFSLAADRYYDEMATAHGAHHADLKSIPHRKTVFIAICGDRPVTEYTAADIQTFMNRVRFLAPNQSKQPGYDIGRVLEYIAEAEAAGTPGIAQSTLVNNYVGKIKTIIKAACDAADLPYTLGGKRLKVPKGVPKPKAKFLVDEKAATRLFAAASTSGLLAETMLPLLGYLTGRRLGLLAFLQGEDIREHDGVWLVTPRAVVLDADGKWTVVPFKTGESLSAFVLHDLLVRIGFVDWARRQGGFVFKALHEAKDPADTASKRMCRLFEKAGIDPAAYKTFHGLRHAKINRDRDIGIDARTTRLQVGHELLDVHDAYGGSAMRRTELHTVAFAELPSGIDFDVFSGLNFNVLAAARTLRGRPGKTGNIRQLRPKR